MKIYASLITVLLISSLSLAALPLANAMAIPPTITAPWGAPPTIDGTWTGTEWDNVPEYLMKGPGGTSYIRIKHDNSHLFIIIDSPWDTSVASVYDSENCWTAFDAAHNHGSDPQVDDWLFDNPHSSSQVDLEAWNGTGSGWGDPAFGHLALGFYAEGSTRNPGPGLQTSPHSSTPHRIDEIKVPLECAVKLCTSAGFYALVVDDTDPSNYVEWPSSGGNPTGWPPWENPNPAPDAWGDLILGSAPSLMHAPPVAVPVTVDGIWSTGEWDDAPQYAMGGPGCQKGFVRAKFNATHLLVVIDSPWDTMASTLYYHENAWLAFDTLNNGGFTPLADDYMIHASTGFTSMGWQGNPAGGNWTMAWLGWAGAFACAQAGDNFGAFPLQPSPNSATPHRITEFAVPLNLVGYSPSTVGFYVMIDDDSTDPDGTGWLPATSYAEWPLGSGGSPGWPGAWGFAPPSAPMAWGDLALKAPTMYAPSRTVPVTVDGVWSLGEWADAPQYTVKGPSCQKGFIRAKFNATHLFVVIDSPWDTTPSTLYYHENIWLVFDTLNDGGSTPLADDFMIHASTEFTSMGWQGNPAGGNWTMAWLGWAGAFACTQAGGNFGTFPLQPSPNSATPHRITEFAVPLNLVGYSPSTVGFYVLLDDDSTDPDGVGYLPPTSYAEWPSGSGGSPGWPGAWGFAPPSAPMAWGKLILASPPTVHDVAVTQIVPLKTVIGQAHTCGINVTLANEGASSETFDVALYANTTSIGTKAVTVASGSSAVVTFGWNTTGCAKGNYTMSAFAWPVADEIDTTDNTLISGEIKVVTPGDVNADGVVNIVDSAGISAHWYPGPPIGPLGYHVDFDVNEDGKIGIQDAALVSAYWTGPPKGPLAE